MVAYLVHVFLMLSDTGLAVCESVSCSFSETNALSPFTSVLSLFAQCKTER